MKIVGAIQWLSTAFVIFMVIAWVANGDPRTTTQLLWGVQDVLVDGAVEFARDADINFPDVSAIRNEEDALAEEIRGYSFPNPWIEDERPLGQVPELEQR